VPELTLSRVPAMAGRLLRTRWIARVPVWPYRARLGFMFGSRLLMLEHTGRKDGFCRYVVPKPSTTRTRAPASWRPASASAPSGSATSAPAPRPRLRRLPSPDARLSPPADQRGDRRGATACARGRPRAWATPRPVFEATLGARIGSDGTSLSVIALDLGDASRPGTLAGQAP
jgi:hypothetical protein